MAFGVTAHCNANPANVAENRRQAAQQAGHESHDHCDEQTEIHTARSNVLVEKKSVIGDGPKDWSAGLAKSA